MSQTFDRGRWDEPEWEDAAIDGPFVDGYDDTAVFDDAPISAALPTTLGSRITLVLVNLVLIPASLGTLWLLHQIPPPRAWQWRIVYYLFIECVLLFLIICVLSFLWGLLRPRVVARVFDGLYAKFFVVVAVSLASAWVSIVLLH
jgi:hypothetical protein